MEPTGTPGKRGRPRKYATDEERKAAKAEAARRKLHEWREQDPEGYREWQRARTLREMQKLRDARAVVQAAEQEGGSRLQAPEVAEARAITERERSRRQGSFKRYYDSHPEFRERHRAKMAEYSRQRHARLKETTGA